MTRTIVTIAGRVLAVFAIAFTLGTVVPQIGAVAAKAAVTASSPAQEEAACAALLHFHHVNAAGWMDGTYRQQQEWNLAWLHAWHAANYADLQTRAAVHEYLFTDTHWMAAYINACAYGS